MTTIGEIEFYNLVQDECNMIFDVGCREDIHYIEMSKNDKNKAFHLFEPNLAFYIKCQDKLRNINNYNQIILNNFGLGNKTDELEYYEDSQSFIKRHVHFQSKSNPVIFKIKRFTEYINENSINEIDFLKIDTEGCEPDILLDNIDFINNHVKYIQFEYASTWLDRNDDINLSNIIDIFGGKFDFYFLYNEDHPLSKYNPNLLSKIYDERIIKGVDLYMHNQYGFEIVMIRNSL